jgi:hypothetical protein
LKIVVDKGVLVIALPPYIPTLTSSLTAEDGRPSFVKKVNVRDYVATNWMFTHRQACPFLK